MSYILNYIAEGEHVHQDFKMRIDDARKIARTLSAFANTEGGRILIGVKDNGSVCGIRAEEEIHMIQAAAEMYCKPPVHFSAQLWKVEYKSVLEIKIEPSASRPHYAHVEGDEWIAYLRSNDENHPVPPVILELWRGGDDDRPQRYFHTEKEKRIFTALDAQGPLTFSQIKRQTKIPSYILTRLLARFIRWNLIEWDFRQGHPLYRLKP